MHHCQLLSSGKVDAKWQRRSRYTVEYEGGVSDPAQDIVVAVESMDELFLHIGTRLEEGTSGTAQRRVNAVYCLESLIVDARPKKPVFCNTHKDTFEPGCEHRMFFCASWALICLNA